MINIPQKIICHVKDSHFIPVIPVCGVHTIGEKRVFKYYDLWAELLHIRKKGAKEWYSGEIVEPNLEYEEYPLPSPSAEEDAKRTAEEVEKAKNYTDKELDEGQQQGNGSSFNLNLMDYVNFPFEEGIYEIYYSTCGLESNHMEVEIVFKK